MSQDPAAISSDQETGKSFHKVNQRQLNQKAWQGLLSDESQILDSSLKRNTAFIKRLRTNLCYPDSVSYFVKEASSLRMDKYTSEIVSAAVEAISKCKVSSEIQASVEVLSTLHQRLGPTFTDCFLTQLSQLIQPPAKTLLATYSAEQREREEASRVTKQRNLLRVYAELDIASVIQGNGEATFALLKSHLTDKDLLVVSVPLAVSFMKHEGYAFLPPTDSSQDPTPSMTAEASSTDENGLSYQMKDKFRKFFVAYYDVLGRRAVRDHTRVLETERRNMEAYIKAGEIFEDRAQNYERLTKAWEKLWSGVQSLSELLSLPLPELPPLSTEATQTTIGFSSSAQESETLLDSKWIDEEERRFYEDIVDLKNEVPSGYLVSPTSSQIPQNEVSNESTKPTIPENKGEVEAEVLSNDGAMDEAEDEENSIPAGPAAQLAVLLAQLSEIRSRDMIDRAAVEFITLNNKPARKKLIKALTHPPKGQSDLLPYYSRLIATVGKYFTDIPTEIISVLEDEFRYLQKRKTIGELYELRTKNARFLAELTKFGVVPDHVILHCIKVCVDNFTNLNIDMLCDILEGCGRYLLRTESTQNKMTTYLEIMRRKAAQQHLDQRQIAMVENAYYQCNPSDRPVVEPKVFTPQQLFIRHVLTKLLVKNPFSRKTEITKVLKIIRRLHWDDPITIKALHNGISKIWKINFGNIPLFALLMRDLSTYQPEFTVGVVDQVLENIRFGLEKNNFKHNQRRLASVKYLGELYLNYVVDSRIVLDTLWTFTTFGYRNNRPTPESFCQIDMPDDFFRVRLICTLLDTTARTLDKRGFRNRLDNFLVFFQLYIFCKVKMPMEIEFQVSDTFEAIRPKMELYKSFDEAVVGVNEMMMELVEKAATFHGDLKTPVPVSNEEAEDFDESEGESSNTESSMDDGREAEIASDDEDENDDDDDEGTQIDNEEGEETKFDDDTVSRRKSYEVSNEEEEDFNRELAKMMIDSDKRVAPRRQNMLHVDLPVMKKNENLARDESDEDGEQMKFTLLTKRGPKAQTKTMKVPSTASLAVHTRSKQIQDKEEQQQLKRLVLQYEQNRDDDLRTEIDTEPIGKRAMRVRFDEDNT